MKYGYREIRTISSEDIRNMCIKNDWYDNGTNEEYNNLLSYSKEPYITSDEIIEMATDIYSHTQKFVNTPFNSDIVSAIGSIIAKYCISYFEEID